jgi:hypothetical protein
MADALARVQSPADAQREAARVQPIIARQKALTDELAAMKYEIPPEQYRPVLARHQAQIQSAGQRAIRAQARVLGNMEMLTAWGRGLKAAAGTSPKPPPPVPGQDSFDEKLNTYLEVLEQVGESFDQIGAALESVQDEQSARAAAEQIRRGTPVMEERFRRHAALMIRFNGSGDLGRIMQEVHKRGIEPAQGPRMMDQIKRVAEGPHREQLKEELRGIYEVFLRAETSQRRRAEIQKKINELRLGP